MVRMCNEFKEAVEWTSNKIKKDMKETVVQTANNKKDEMRAEMRKLQTEVSLKEKKKKDSIRSLWI